MSRQENDTINTFNFLRKQIETMVNEKKLLDQYTFILNEPLIEKSMKNRIEKLKKKRDKIDLDIKELEHEKNLKEKCDAFDLIMELGQKHNLFYDVSQDIRYDLFCLGQNITDLTITIRPPHDDYTINC